MAKCAKSLIGKKQNYMGKMYLVLSLESEIIIENKTSLFQKKEEAEFKLKKHAIGLQNA